MTLKKNKAFILLKIKLIKYIYILKPIGNSVFSLQSWPKD